MIRRCTCDVVSRIDLSPSILLQQFANLLMQLTDEKLKKYTKSRENTKDNPVFPIQNKVKIRGGSRHAQNALLQ